MGGQMPKPGEVQPKRAFRVTSVAPERQPSPGFGRRLRAAIIIAANRNEDIAATKLALARELNVSTRTLDRLVAEKRWPSEWEVDRLASLLEVPDWFLRSGFTVDGSAADEERLTLERLDHRLESLEAEMTEAVRLTREALELLRAGQEQGSAASESPLATEHGH